MDAKFGNVGGIQYVYRGVYDHSDLFYCDMDSGVPRGCKALKKNKLEKMIKLLSAGSLSTLILVISLFQQLPL